MTLDLTALKAALEAATQGEWLLDSYIVFVDTREQVCCGRGYQECCGEPDIRGGREQVAESNETDAAYIVAAQPRVMRELIAEAERLREALGKIAEERDAGRHDGLPEPCPAHEAEVMWRIARAALTAGEIKPEGE